MEKMNEAFGMKNCVAVGEGGGGIICPFRSQEFWKCIGCIIPTVTYRKK